MFFCESSAWPANRLNRGSVWGPKFVPVLLLEIHDRRKACSSDMQKKISKNYDFGDFVYLELFLKENLNSLLRL